MTMLAEVADAVIGVDTHLDTHALQIAHPTGVPIATLTISNDDEGYAEALRWTAQHAPGPKVFIAMEGTRSYGVGFARALAHAGLPVIEVLRPARTTRRGRGKTDQIDADLAVLAALRMDIDKLPVPRADGPREALRILLGARQDLTGTRTAQVNRLRALLLTGDDADRALARGAMTAQRLDALARRRGRTSDNVEQAVRRSEARRLALAIRAADRTLADNKRQLTNLVEQLVPGLQERHGIGPVSGAQAIVSFSHHGRCRNEAAYAALAGSNPIPADSGKTQHRHRLNRGGDRALNRALHAIAHTRMTSDPRTRAYVARRTAQGKTRNEIRRCLKRYIARELFRALNTAAPA